MLNETVSGGAENPVPAYFLVDGQPLELDVEEEKDVSLKLAVWRARYPQEMGRMDRVMMMMGGSSNSSGEPDSVFPNSSSQDNGNAHTLPKSVAFLLSSWL